MCGIAGGLNLSPESLEDMLRRLHHRGPDGRGTYRSPDGRTALGMTRLAILDLDHGQQPFASSCGKVHAVCNGEIYNWRELRQELESLGHRFRTSCDCEILPAAWLEWSDTLPQRLNGMFAFAIHDQREDLLFLARDRCGQKPLYHTTRPPFFFSSEIKALPVSKSPSPGHLHTWLRLRYLPEPETLYQNICSLPAAHFLKIRAGQPEQPTRYWTPTATPLQPLTDPLDQLEELTRSAVQLAAKADVPIAAYLSAGVDSTLLCKFLTEANHAPHTVSIGFGAASDETPEAEKTAATLGLTHSSVTLTPETLEDLPRVVTQMDRPVGDALILAFDHLAQHTARAGYKVVLGGEGPDEHFCGYSFQSAYLKAQRLPPLFQKAISAALSLTPLALLNRFAQFPAPLDPTSRRKIARYLKDFSAASSFDQLTGLHTLIDDPETFLTGKDHLPPSTQLPGLLESQYSHWLPDWSLIRQDRNSMAHSLEYRAPFLDHRIIDFALSQPIQPDKALWRALAARHLPPGPSQRTKQPFYLPLEQEPWRAALVALARRTLTKQALTSHGFLDLSQIEPLFHARTFLPLKKLAALTILQLWLAQF